VGRRWRLAARDGEGKRTWCGIEEKKRKKSVEKADFSIFKNAWAYKRDSLSVKD
jgi:hypothetical protein